MAMLRSRSGRCKGRGLAQAIVRELKGCSNGLLPFGNKHGIITVLSDIVEGRETIHMGIAQLDVFGVTNNGKLWHTIRTMERSVDTWKPWEDVEASGAGGPGPFISMDCARLLAAVRVCGITHDGKLWYSSSLPQQAWQPFDDVTVRIGDHWGKFRNLGIAETGEGLHVCVTASTASGRWRMLHTIRHEDGTWDAFQDVNALTHFAGSFISIDCEGIGDDLHVCGVTHDGKLWHTIRSSQSAWQPFKDVQKTATNAPDRFSSVSIAAGDI